MSAWTKVRWTQARQVTRLLGMRDRDAPAETVSPAAHYETLRDAGRLGEAVAFLGQALPRYEGVVWAAEAVAKLGRPAPAAAEAKAMAAVRAWIEEPEDGRRRAAYAACEAAEDGSPEKLLGLAVWFSGGSLAPADLQAVAPPPEVCGRMAAVAVIAAAHGSADPDAGLAQALAAGEAVARGGA